MHNNSQKSARPLVFNTKRDIYYNVMGNNSQAYSVSIPQMPNKTAPAFYPSSSLFDRYNRPNLLLRDCDPKDIITLHKNLVMSEQPLSKDLAEEIVQKAAKNTGKEMAMTGQLFKKEHVVDHLLQTAPSVPTREYQQNEIFFNYKEMAQIKRDKKMQFLEEIENRIAEAEQQIAGLQDLQAQQRIEMGDLTRFQQKVGEQLTRNVQVGKVKQKVGYVTGFQEEQHRQPISIHQEMQPRQINEVLEEHIKINEDLLELAGSLRRKSLEKAKDKMEKTGQNANTFSSTMYRTNQQSKTLVSTMKAGFKPPKGKPNK